MKPEFSQFRQLQRSFQYAFTGIGTMLVTQRNARIHAAGTVALIACGFLAGVARLEWCWLILALMALWTAEALNTAFEFLADVTSPEYHPLVKKAKDVAAGAVLMAAIGTATVSLLVFAPYILRLCR